MKKDIKLKSDGLTIVGQLFLPEGSEPPFPAVILCHGIPSGIVDPADGGYPALATTLAQAGFAAIVFSFRGTGASEGDFNIAGWTRDLAAVVEYAWALPEIDDSHIALVGFSAGASVSICVAAQDKRISSVVSCAGPADFSAISESDKYQQSVAYFRKIGIIRREAYPDSIQDWVHDFRKTNALHHVSGISPRPLLLVHSTGDPIVSVVDSRRLYQQAGEPKQIVILDGDEHRLRRSLLAVDTIVSWLKENI